MSALEDRIVPDAVTVGVTWLTDVGNFGDAIEGTTDGLLRFTRDGDIMSAVNVTYTVGGSAAPGVDYTALSGTATIPMGASYVEVPVVQLDDSIAEYSETVEVTIADMEEYDVGAGYTSVRILDNETPVVMVDRVVDALEGPDSGWFVVTRLGDLSQSLVVNFATPTGGTATPGTDYTALASTVTIAADDNTAYVEVEALDDSVADPNETVTLTLATGNYNPGTPSSASMIIVDNDVPVVWIGPFAQTVTEGHATDVSVYRSGGNLTQPLTVSLAIGIDMYADPIATWNTDYTLTGPVGGSSLSATGGTVTFGSNEDEVVLNMAALADAVSEGAEGLRITVLPSGTDYQVGWDSTGGWAADTADVQIAPNAPPVVEDESESTHADAIEGAVDGYDPDGDELSFSLGTGPVKGQVTVNADGTFTYTPNAGATGTDTFTVTADDGVGGTGMATVTVTFTNEDPVPDSQITAAWPGQAVTFGWTGTDYDGDPLSVIGWTTPQYVSGATLGGGYGTVGYNSSTGEFTYTPPDSTWTGTASFDFTVDDGHGGTGTATTTVNVLAPGTAGAVNDNYQISDDGTLTLAADEGVLANDFILNGQGEAVLAASLDPSIGTLTLNVDGGFAIALTAAAMADTTPVSFTYNIVPPQGGGTMGTAIVTLQKGISRLLFHTWFRATEVTFGLKTGPGTIKPITPDNDQNSPYRDHQWLDKNADGTPDEKNPVQFVRNNADSVTADSVIMRPIDPKLNLDPTKYRLYGEVYLSGTATGIVLRSATGSLTAGKDWKFQNLMLKTGSNTFPSVAYYPEMTVLWTMQRDGEANFMYCGQTKNPAYIRLLPLSGTGSGKSYKLLQTFVALGSDGPDGAAVTTPEAMVERVWSKFVAVDGTPMVETWDGHPLVYYNEWLYRDTGPYTQSAHLVRVHDGDCTSFARLFIDALRAQGIERDDDFWIIKPVQAPKTTGLPLMFVGSWTANDGRQVSNNPADAAYRWLNRSTAVSANGNRVGWEQANGAWQYSWVNGANDVTKAAGDQLFGQNNETPLGIFGNHVIVKFGNTFYDPSYGTTATEETNEARLKAWEDAAIGYYGLRKDLRLGVSVTYWLKPNPTAANTAAGVVRVSGTTNY